MTGRALVDDFEPASLALVRWSLSGLVIAAFALTRPQAERWRAPASHLLRVGVLGALGMGFCAYAAYIASRTTEATNIGLIYGCASAFVAAWEIAAGRQRASALLLVGIAACLMGAVLILTKGRPEVLLGLTFTPGDLWAAAGMLVFVGYTVAHAARAGDADLDAAVRRHVPWRHPGPAAVRGRRGRRRRPAAARRSARCAWIAVVVLATGIGAFLGYNISLKRNGPVLTSASLTLTPAFAAGQAMLLIGEQLAWYHAAAIALVVAGLLLINRDQARRRNS